MQYNNEKIKQILLSRKYVSEEAISKAEASFATEGGTIIDYLLKEKLITKDLVGQAVAESLGMNYADLNSYPPSKEQVLLIPKEIALVHRVVVFQQNDDEVVFASDVPEKAKTLPAELASVIKGRKATLAYTLTEDLDNSFMYYRQALTEKITEIVKTNEQVAPEILGAVIEEAVVLRSSDIHLEPLEKEVVLRFRIDGAMREIARFTNDIYENILNRVKVDAKMRVDDHFSAQDGAIRYESAQIAADLRVSVVPTLDGEKIAIRLLSAYVKGFTLWDLGFSETHQKLIEVASKKPFGMILTVGPTGSGKTTTLYALVKLLNTKEVNITTIEDPAEYKISGVNQIQVNEQTNLTFAKGLRSIVRQDPDIILVGEIRDEETAEIAVNAALTGHLLFSTFHANDAATAIPRLLDMHVAPFLLASTLELIVAQRLVRKICEQCRTSNIIDTKTLATNVPNPEKYFDVSKGKVTLYKGKGCEVCGGTGYKGRTAIFELIPVDAGLRELILKSPGAKDVWTYAISKGAEPMFIDGVVKVKQGITTIEELVRVAPVNEYEQG